MVCKVECGVLHGILGGVKMILGRACRILGEMCRLFGWSRMDILDIWWNIHLTQEDEIST